MQIDTQSHSTMHKNVKLLINLHTFVSSDIQSELKGSLLEANTWAQVKVSWFSRSYSQIVIG